MAFKAIGKTNKKHDCKDFKPYFFDKRYCKLTFKCVNAVNEYVRRRHYDARGLFDLRCTGIEKDEKMKQNSDMPEMRDIVKKR